MKIKVIKDCWFDGEYVKKGRIIDFKGKNLPSWATLADGISVPKKQNKQGKSTSIKLSLPPEQKEPDTVSDTAKKPVDDIEITREDKEITKEDVTSSIPKEMYLELLLNEGIEKNIFIENADKKTVDEQITELENLLTKE